MKQGRIFIRVITAIFFVAVLCYIAYAVFQAVYDPLTTSVAIEYEAGEACFTTGYVMRHETLLTSSYPITVLSRSEGEKVGAGQTVAVGYLDDSAQQRQDEIDELTARLEQLEYAYSADLVFSDISTLESSIVSELTTAAADVNRRDFTSAAAAGSDLKSMVLRRYADDADLAEIQSEVASIESQLASLTSQTGSDTRIITTSSPGYFSGTADGFESLLDPDKLSLLSVAQLESIEASVEPVADHVFGKIITGDTWYYAAIIPTDYAALTGVGETVSVTFSQDLLDEIDMTVAHIGEDTDGRCVIVLSCSHYLSEVTLLRHVSADIVFSSYAGLRVPKNAIRLNEEGEAGVYVIEGSTARWKTVTILYDNGESYVVELDKSDTSNLWPGDEIIVSARDLYDGKVVSTS